MPSLLSAGVVMLYGTYVLVLPSSDVRLDNQGETRALKYGRGIQRQRGMQRTDNAVHSNKPSEVVG